MPCEILNGIYKIVLPTPFPVGPVNCIVTTEPPITLIDTGTLWEPSRQALMEQLSELNLTLKDIQRIIITHPHADHFGMAAEIADISGAQVWTHPVNRSYLNPSPEFIRIRDQFYDDILSQCGVPEDERTQFFSSRSGRNTFWSPIECTHFLDEGDEISLAQFQWRVYHTPGHSGGLICLFNQDTRTLLCNDHLLRRISSNPIMERDPDGGPRPHRLVQYLQQLQRINELQPSVAWTGHGDIIDDVPKIIRHRMRYHARRAKTILDMISQQPMTVHQISRNLFGTRSGFDCFLTISETVGHLDWLVEQGKAEPIEADACHLWTPTAQL
jgi:glyoxylase-like metal-dependent hydrolase (beta-lactamase superfamily II)